MESILSLLISENNDPKVFAKLIYEITGIFFKDLNA